MYNKLLKLALSTTLLVSILLISSCNKDNQDTPPLQQQNNNIANRQVSSEQAKKFANLIANNLFSAEENGAQLKSATAHDSRSISKIQAIVSETKDTVMFSVNFNNNKGFILISGDKGDSPIVALSDSGAFDTEQLNPTVAIWLEEQKSTIALQMSSPLLAQETNENMWDELNTDTTMIEFEFVSDIPNLKSCPKGEDPSGRTTVYPYTGTINKWGQGTGYNFNAPVRNALAGCPSVAIGQLCFDQKFPSNYNYSGMVNQLPNNYNRQSPISLMLRDIGDNIPRYSWSTDGSGASPANILIGLKALGYTNAKFNNYNLISVYNDLKKGAPVLLAAHQNGGYNGGHIWFCDGYYEAKVKITHKRWRPFKWRVHCVVYRYDDYLYMNWGWNGDHNGWFRSDNNDNWKPQDANFNYQRKMYTNLKPVR